MRKFIGPVLLVLLLVELSVAGVILYAQRDSFFNPNLNFDGWNWETGPQRRLELPAQTFDTGGNSGNIEVRSDNGKIELIGTTNSNEVIVKATKVVFGNSDSAFDKLRFEATRNGNDLLITAKRTEPVVGGFSGHFEIQITAPANMVAKLHTNNGTINASNLSNPEARHQFDTDNGTITLSQVKANRIDLTTHNGLVNARNLEAAVQADTSNGQIKIQDSVVSIEKVKSNNGQIDISGQLKQTANGNIETSNGNIRLDLTDANGVKFDASTNLGNVDFRLNGTSFDTKDRKHIITSGNGPTVWIKTNIGNVTVE